MKSQKRTRPIKPQRAPSRRDWPSGLRKIARRMRLYDELELLRTISPSTTQWLLQHWNKPQGKRALEIIKRQGAAAFVELNQESL
ncbi:hypothetical protein [Acidihalobacter ferrooxydans]|uniref:Uncharacterized protein n=1 Tax=Acidihalobacter ferrooxydans TaxID=1765967 RepID=A0A1P8UFL8_9GAMM|nr:hypothetical protein [Acidihalobacter ferrooxydans]APZ42636.1 hypothetical protein BW247_05595 [Acidihalobacter ferrooxydans]